MAEARRRAPRARTPAALPGRAPAKSSPARAPAPPSLSLAVQYGVAADALPRWRLRRWAQRALAGLPRPPAHTELTLRLVGQREGRQLNRDFRERDYATNVLTFEYGFDLDGTARGDIVLCLPVLRREAREQGKPLLSHAAHLTIHGVLHALGYDHLDPAEAERMEALETAILAGMGIPDPYAA